MAGFHSKEMSLSIPSAAQQTVANAATVTSVASVALTWMSQIQGVLQIIATLVAIVAGLAAARFHLKKTHQIKAHEEDSNE
jgi:membrane protein implicated in regulation of membrane protease activity